MQICYFFFQAEDGIRDWSVTGVQTCALPISSLSLANVTVSTSQDGGKTWSKNVLSATIPGDDREWIAADQASKVCISYHEIGRASCRERVEISVVGVS